MSSVVKEAELLLDDLDFDPTCEAELCDRHVDYSCVLKCCGKGNLICSYHFQVFVEYFKDHKRRKIGMYCIACNHRIPKTATSVHDIMDVTRL